MAASATGRSSNNIATVLAGASGPILFAVTTLIAHRLAHNYDWIQETISQLVLAPYGWIQVAGFLALGLSVISLSIGLRAVIPPGRYQRPTVIVLALVGFGFVLVGSFPTENADVLTVTALIHQGAVRLIAVLFPIACFLLTLSFKNDPRWRGVIWLTITAGILSFLLDIAYVVTPQWLLQPMIGLYERILATNGLAWFEALSIRLLALYRHKGQDSISVPSSDSIVNHVTDS